MTMNRREVMVWGSVAAVVSALPAFAMEPSNIAERFCQHLAKLGVTPVFNEENAEFGKVGAKITSLTPSGALLIQRHVDWSDMIINGVPQKRGDCDVEAALGALSRSVARSIRPDYELKTFSLFVPNDIHEGGLVSHKHMVLRTLRLYQPYRQIFDENGEEFDAGEHILNRIDILYPATGAEA
jgi:hypothetical protein